MWPWGSSWGAVPAPLWPCWSLAREGCWLQLPQGRRSVLGLAVLSSAGWAEPVAGVSVGLQGQACRAALGVAWPGAAGEGTQPSSSELMSGGQVPVASWFTGRFGREFHRRGHSQS